MFTNRSGSVRKKDKKTKSLTDLLSRFQTGRWLTKVRPRMSRAVTVLKKVCYTRTSLFITAIRRAQIKLLFVHREVEFGTSTSPSYLRVHHDAIPARITITAHSNSVEIDQLTSRIRPDVLKHRYRGCRCFSFFLFFLLVPLLPWLHMPRLRSNYLKYIFGLWDDARS